MKNLIKKYKNLNITYKSTYSFKDSIDKILSSRKISDNDKERLLIKIDAMLFYGLEGPMLFINHFLKDLNKNDFSITKYLPARETKQL